MYSHSSIIRVFIFHFYFVGFNIILVIFKLLDNKLSLQNSQVDILSFQILYIFPENKAGHFYTFEANRKCLLTIYDFYS